MLTRLHVRNFKRLVHADIELGDAVVFIGPNNSGKTSALQALSLWNIGVKRWNEKRSAQGSPEKRPGVAINRRDLIAIPVPDANLLWRDLHVREIRRSSGRQDTRNVRVDITVEGITNGRAWRCGMEFDYANEESIYCRPLRQSDDRPTDRMPVPPEAAAITVAYLPPMSGLASNETRLDTGAVNVRIGEGRTAEVLRNLCMRISESDPDCWTELVRQVKAMFGATLQPPRYIVERGEIAMTFEERGIPFDLSSSGRGLQQTLLLLSFMYANPGAALLLDEPDAHLEILRQRQVYQVLTEAARATGSQVIAASHSEVVLSEAAERDVVIAFVGKPHRINDRGSQVQKALREIGFEDYYQAEQTNWVLYLEGSTDLAILQALARRTNHEAARRALERPFVKYVGSDVQRVAHHFHGLREAVPTLRGLALFDRIEKGLPEHLGVQAMMWRRREIESYLTTRESLMAYARASARAASEGPLFALPEAERRMGAMDEAIQEVERALATLGKGSPWGPDMKVSDDFLPSVFATFYAKLELPNVMLKSNFHVLADHVPRDQLDDEVLAKLDAIAEVAGETPSQRSQGLSADPSP
ncbi:MAG: AAA family ATPase [Chthonomonadales bacterium]|nr:AAA family ATPase [Chthonomonadales bacterium]